MRRGPLALLLAVALLAACGGDPAPPPVDPRPVLLGEQAPDAEADQSSLPLALSGQPVLDPGWDQVPRELDGLLLGPAQPGEGEALRFVAAREDGTLLWQAERPPSCTGYTLSEADGRPVAVLTDLAPGDGDRIAGTTASAYDLATGEPLWGPTPVPGPHQGPGTVFAAPAPGATMGDTGPRVVLDPATGEVLADEEDGGVVVGEFAGVVLTAADGVLAAEGRADWQVPLADLGLDVAPVALPGVEAPRGTALLAERGDTAGTLVDLDSGAVLAERVSDAVRDPVSGTLVTLAGETVAGYPDPGESWEREMPGVRLSAAGNVFAYLRTDTTVSAVNVVTGGDAVAYDGTATSPAVPVLVTERGAAVLDGADLVLVPTTD